MDYNINYTAWKVRIAIMHFLSAQSVFHGVDIPLVQRYGIS